MKEINFYKIHVKQSIREAVNRMDQGGIGFCVCIDNDDKVIGVVADSDFRKGILKGIKLGDRIETIMNSNPVVVEKNYDNDVVDELFRSKKILQIPVVDKGALIDIIIVEDFYGIKDYGLKKNPLELPVVIMAGGKGTRLDPFTRILPKPLIPVGKDPIIKVIMDEFRKFGINDFTVTLNEKSKMIKAYFFDHENDYRINYIEETVSLGTAGSLRNLGHTLDSPFFVHNCDIIIYTDYYSIYDFHKEGNFDLTMVASMRHHTIPYGVCEITDGGTLKNVKEKPVFDVMVSTGMYIVNPDVISIIPEGEKYDMTELIQDLQKKKKKVGVYPITQQSWLDLGQWEEYNQNVKMFFDA